MAGGRGAVLALLALLAVGVAQAIKEQRDRRPQRPAGFPVPLYPAGKLLSQAAFYQWAVSPPSEAGQVAVGLDADEILHVDLGARRAVWRLPAFATLAAFEAREALHDLAGLRKAMEMLMATSNRTSARNVPPEVRVFPEDPVELGEPNVLICFADKFSPPALNVTWLKNGHEVVDGVTETISYPRQDHTFRKFSYLPFVPTRGDSYDCRVEHWGLPEALLKHWEPQVPPAASESAETLVCALGLAVSIAGTIVGIVLIVSAELMVTTTTTTTSSRRARSFWQRQ
ncbi:RLA class II histocompatibility antigen, DP alpha-1 chain-like [Apteryx mantelli]|uniref:RLA class II histocompatibility antigen, DP alpha-1 chain-like n=1 Tax=Apteryx mantelli TaxID=2696672 RepID=A0ABM4FY93_9AVES